MNDLVISFLIKNLLKHKSLLSFSFTSLLLMGLGHGALLTLMGPFIQELTGQPSQLPLWAQPFFSTLNDSTYQIPIAIIAAGMIKVLGTYGFQWNTAKVAVKTTATYRKQLFCGLLSSNFEDIQKKQPGEWMSILMNDVQVLQREVIEALTATIRDGAMIIASWMTLWFISPLSAFSLIIVGPTLAWIMGKVGNRIRQFATTYQKLMANLSAIFFDQRQRFEMIRAQHGEEYEINAFEQINNQHFHFVKKSIFIRAAFAPALEWIGFCFFAFWIFAINKYPENILSGTNLVLFFAVLASMLRPLKSLGEQMSRLQEVRGILENGRQLLSNSINLQPQKSTSNTQHPDSIRSLQFKRKNFLLNLEKLDLTPRAVAIIGQSGSGKSTFAKILASLIPPSIWEAPLQWNQFCTSVTMVSQQPFLFSGTLHENLCYGLDSLPTDEDIQHALWVVDMDQHVHSLPEHLHTTIDSLKNGFSGGQLQRLTLARGLLNPSPILIVDEVTSSLDQACENTVMNRMIKHCKSKNQLLIAITHRLSWLDLADEVWWMEGGQLKAKGTHHDLQEQSAYRQYVQAEDRSLHLEPTH